MGRAKRWAGLGWLWMAAVIPGAASAQIEWEPDRWEVDAEDAEFTRHQGRAALRLQNGTAWLRGLSLRDGTVEFDLAVTPDQGFHGLAFRVLDETGHEHVYVRPHRSGFFDAIQYTPVFHGLSGWQIYTSPRFGGAREVPAGRWMRVRVAFQDSRGEVQVDGGPPLPLPELVRDPVAGSIGLMSSGTAAYFANVVVRPPDGEPVEFLGEEGPRPEAPPPGTVNEWRVSSPFPEDRVDGLAPLAEAFTRGLTWSRAEAGERGIVNLARSGGITDGRNTVFAAVTLYASEARSLAVRLGFSDRVRVYLDGRPLYSGADGYRSRDPRFLGTMGTFDELILPLEPGEHELWLAVSEDFGGWGVQLVLPDGDGQSLGVATVDNPGG